MALLWHRNRIIRQELEHDKEAATEVVELKTKAHRTAIQANKDIMRLNRLLRANGITLKIHIAAGGHNSHE